MAYTNKRPNSVLVPRQTYIDQILPWLDAPVIKVLRGVRRCGKSVLLQQLRDHLLSNGTQPDHVLLINFESLSNAHLLDYQALYQHVMQWAAKNEGRVHVFLDEVQMVAQWERVVNSLRVDLDCDLVLTGSNAWLLSSDLATLLTGRYVEIEVQPLSFSEYVGFRNDHNSIADMFRDYLAVGGMPGILPLVDQASAMTYLRDVSASILLKDVVARNKLRDVDLLERLFAFVLDNLGRPFSARSVSGFLKSQRRTLGSETVYNYLRAMTEACLIYKAERYDLKGRRVMETQEKYFVADHGFAHAWLGNRPEEVPGLLENIVYTELRHRGFSVCIGKQGEQEVDFVATAAGKCLYLQVCYRLADNAVINREFAPLEAIDDNHRKLVLSMDESPASDRAGISRRYLPEFLLDDSW